MNPPTETKTLRDEFAMAALTGAMSDERYHSCGNENASVSEIARYAYKVDEKVPWEPRKAVHTLVAANLLSGHRHRCSERGAGNKAARREALVRSLSESNNPLPLTPSDIDRLAEEWQHRRKILPKENIHE